MRTRAMLVLLLLLAGCGARASDARALPAVSAPLIAADAPDAQDARDAADAQAVPSAPADAPWLSAALPDPRGSIFLAPDEAGAAGPLAISFGRKRPREVRQRPAPAVPLGSARARILLRSLTVPGWGQATMGHRRSAAVFALSEAAIWGTFTAFRIQVAMRTESYMHTARTLAGIDLHGRDEEWRRIVGSFVSNDEYNLLVVARDAANLYYDDPAAYRAYYEAHALRGSDAWSWGSAQEQERYRDQRKEAQRAARRANTALAVAIADRLLSALHAARVAGQPARPQHSWRLEVVPAPADDPMAFQMRVSTRF